jgi:hypothetical protein
VDSTLTTKPSPPSNIPSSSRRPSGPLQIKLRNPPVGRRLLNGSNISNTPSPTLSPSEFFSSQSKSSSLNNTPQTPDLPSDSSLLNTTNKHHEDQFIHSNETSIKAGRDNIRSRNFRLRESPSSTNTRSDSADASSISSSKYHHRQLSNEQETNSD